MSVSEAELEGLGEEERAALIDDDETETEEGVDEPEAEDDAAPEAEAAADDEADADDPDAEGDVEAEQESKPFIPKYQAPPVENFDEQMAALDSKSDGLWNQYQDGDLDSAEYREADRAIQREIRALEDAKRDEDFSRKWDQQSKQQEWGWECNRFLSENPQFRQEVNPDLYTALDANLRRLQMEARDKGQDELDPSLLRLAKQKLLDAIESIAAPNERPVASKNTPKQARQPKKAIPPNLGDMPSAEVAETGGDEWAHLEALGGMELESALAKMSKADEKRYLGE